MPMTDGIEQTTARQSQESQTYSSSSRSSSPHSQSSSPRSQSPNLENEISPELAEKREKLRSALDKIVSDLEKDRPGRQNSGDLYKSWLAKLSDEGIAAADVLRFTKEYFSKNIQDISNNIPSGHAISNKFFDEVWLSGEKLSFDQVKKALMNYKALTDFTRLCVHTTYKAGYGNLKNESRIVANLYEESGSGKPKDAHATMLDDTIIAFLRVIKEKELSEEEVGNLRNELKYARKSRLILPSTTKAIEIELGLYSGKTVDGIGIKKDIPSYKSEVVASIAATSAAHEGKAIAMLLKLFAGMVKYLDPSHSDYHSRVGKVRRYFDEHLGSEIVDNLLDKKVFEIIQNLISENFNSSGKSSKQLRKDGEVEQAHRIDANATALEIITLPDSKELKKSLKNFADLPQEKFAMREAREPIFAKLYAEKYDDVSKEILEEVLKIQLNNYVTAINSMNMFLQSHGDFWEGVAEAIQKDIEQTKSPERALQEEKERSRAAEEKLRAAEEEKARMEAERLQRSQEKNEKKFAEIVQKEKELKKKALSEEKPGTEKQRDSVDLSDLHCSSLRKARSMGDIRAELRRGDSWPPFDKVGSKWRVEKKENFVDSGEKNKEKNKLYKK